MFMGFDENEGDDDVVQITEEYRCPFCSEYFEIFELAFHIMEEHPVERKNGYCPICEVSVAVEMIEHIALEHGFRAQRKRRSRKSGNPKSLSILMEETRERNSQSLSGRLSCIVSSSNAASDPVLSSFISSLANEPANYQPQFHIETGLSKKNSDETTSKRNVETTLSAEDKEEKEKRCEFVQGMLLSTILDDDNL